MFMRRKVAPTSSLEPPAVRVTFLKKMSPAKILVQKNEKSDTGLSRDGSKNERHFI